MKRKTTDAGPKRVSETTMTIRLPARLKERLQAVAAAEGRSLGNLVRRALEEAVGRKA